MAKIDQTEVLNDDLVRTGSERVEIIHVPAETAACARPTRIFHHLAVVVVVCLLLVVVHADGIMAVRRARRVP